MTMRASIGLERMKIAGVGGLQYLLPSEGPSLIEVESVAVLWALHVIVLA